MIFKDLAPSYGDILRIKLCEIYHFGIFVDDKTVVQFGLPPISTFARKNVKVLSTTLNDFSCGFPVQVAVFSSEELSRLNSPEIRVKKALARLGEGGYNILHNNCEHFVMECAFNVHYSLQEEGLCTRWQNRPILNVYFSNVLNFDEDYLANLYPQSRQCEIKETKNSALKQQKLSTWNLLKVGINHTYNRDITSYTFSKSPYGKWSTKDFYFSLSHTDDFAVCVISNQQIGVDLGQFSTFKNQWSSKDKLFRFEGKITGENNNLSDLDLFKLWLKKESQFKMGDYQIFSPQKLLLDTGNFTTLKVDDLYITTCSNLDITPILYKVEDGVVSSQKFELVK